jgi:hypothetical protein
MDPELQFQTIIPGTGNQSMNQDYGEIIILPAERIGIK